MTFEKPTTKAKMYEVLQQIFNYYRVQKEEYVDAELVPLTFERMEFVPHSDNDLLLEARTMLLGKKTREIQEYTAKIDQEIAGLNSKIAVLDTQKEKAIDQVIELYQNSEKKIEDKAIKNGIESSSIVIDKLAILESSMNEKIAQINAEYSQKKSEYTAQIAELETKKSQANSMFDDIYQKEESLKVIELKENQDKIAREVFKYNNSLKEKEIKYENMIIKTNLELKLKFLEIRSSEMSKDQLIQVGYYDDALACVCAYYDTLSASAAYEDLINEERIMVFLEHFYQTAIFMYKTKAGV